MQFQDICFIEWVPVEKRLENSSENDHYLKIFFSGKFKFNLCLFLMLTRMERPSTQNEEVWYQQKSGKLCLFEFSFFHQKITRTGLNWFRDRCQLNKITYSL